MHDIVVGQGWVGPVEFWRLTPGQLWWLIEARMPKEAIERHSAMEDLYQMLEEAEATNGV